MTQSDNKRFSEDMIKMVYVFLRPAYNLIFKRLSPEELRNKEQLKLRAHRDFKEAQDLLLELVMGMERTLIKSKDLAREKNAINFFKFHHMVAKRLADSFAWIIIRDRLTIKNYCNLPETGYIFGSSGYVDEIEVVQNFNKDPKKFAVLNDLTSCLRMGDVTLIDISKPGYTIFEIKSKSLMEIIKEDEPIDTLSDSRNKEVERFARQYIRNELIGSYLKSSEGVDIKTGKKKKWFDATKLPEQYNVKAVEKVLLEAKEKGFSIKEVEDGLVYAGFRKGKMSEKIEGSFMLNKLPKKYANSEIKLPPQSIRMNFWVSHLMPIFMMPINPDLIFDLVFGFLDLYIYLDLPTVFRKVEKEGVYVKMENKRHDEHRDMFHYQNKIIKISRRDNWITLGQHPFGRLFGEATSLSTFLNYWFVPFGLAYPNHRSCQIN